MPPIKSDSTGARDYLPLVPPRRRDFIYGPLIAIVAFIIFDMVAALFPPWAARHRAGIFPGFFTYFGVAVGIILLFIRMKTCITINARTLTLSYTFITAFRPLQVREYTLEDARAELRQHPNGRSGKAWVLKVYKGGKRVFSEKENAARYNEAMLRAIYDDLTAVIAQHYPSPATIH